MYSISDSVRAKFDTGRKNIKVCHGITELTVQSVQYRATMGERLTLGAVNAASLTVRAFNCPNLAGETITARIETDDGTGIIPLGEFVVDTFDTTDTLSTIVAYDAVWASLSSEYVPRVDTPPTTVLGVLGDVAAQLGLSMMSTAGITDVSVDGTLTGYTYREIVGHMAALLGRNAYINRTGELALRGYTDNGQTLGPSNYYAGGLKLGEEQTLTGVRMVRKETTTTTDADGITTETETTTTYTAGAGTGVVIEIDNPFATQAIVTAVWAALSSAVSTYRLGTCEFYGGYDVDPGDLLTVTDTGDNACVFPVMSVTLELDGGCRGRVEATGQTETAMSTNIRGPTGRLLSKIQADLGEFRNLTAQNFEAAIAKVNTLYADDAWVRNLFSQYIRAVNLDVTGASKFSGVIDAVYATFGDIIIGDIGLAETRGDAVYVDPADWPPVPDPPNPDELPDVVIYGGYSVPRAGGNPPTHTLMGVKFWVTADDTSRDGEEANFGFSLEDSNDRILFSFPEDGQLLVNGDAVEFPVAVDTFNTNDMFGYYCYPAREMIGCTIHVSEYYGDRGAISASRSISTGTEFIEAGTKLEDKYAAIDHDHDADYAAIDHDHDGAYLPLSGGTVSGNLSVSGKVTASNIPTMQWGNTGNIPNVSTTAQTLSVNFPTAFDGTPRVFLTPMQNGGYYAVVKTLTVTKTGFTLGIATTAGTSSSIQVNWLAIYQP